MTSFHPPVAVVGYTHASSVIPLVRSKVVESFTVTKLDPLKERALPNLPCADQVGPVSVPVLEFPDASAVVVPVPSLNEYAATSPLFCGATPTPKAIT